MNTQTTNKVEYWFIKSDKSSGEYLPTDKETICLDADDRELRNVLRLQGWKHVDHGWTTRQVIDNPIEFRVDIMVFEQAHPDSAFEHNRTV
jgi:hypothetical protein